jgi:DNA-binding PadR family transcriptional regulator
MSTPGQPPSTLGFALLTLLAREPDTAYGLSTRLRRPVGHFWTARYSQVHGELERLRQRGLVTFETRHGPGPHDKKVYAPTAPGRAALADWVATPLPIEPSRSELMLRAYAIWAADPVAAAMMVAGRLAAHRAALGEWELALAAVTADGVPPRDSPNFGNLATLRYGIGYERNAIDWCEWLLAELTR